jgi:hypothetical protein
LRENSLKVALEQQEIQDALQEVEQNKKASISKRKKKTIPEPEVSEEWSPSSTDFNWDDDLFLGSNSQDLPDSWKNDDPDKKF